MFNVATTKAVFLIPSSAWDTRLTIAPSRDRLKLKRLQKESILPEDIPNSLSLGVNGREELRIVARDCDGTLNWVKPDDYTLTINSGGCVGACKSMYGPTLLGIKASSAPACLTATLNDNPDVSTSMFITVEAPQHLWLVRDHGRYDLDIQRRHVIDSRNGYILLTAEDVCRNELSDIPGSYNSFRILGRYGDGRYAWLNNSEVQAVVSAPDYLELSLTFPDEIAVTIWPNMPFGSTAELSVKSIMDSDVQCSVSICCKSEHNAGDLLARNINNDCIVSVFTAFKDGLELAANRARNNFIRSRFSRLKFGYSEFVVLDDASGSYREEAVLLYSYPSRRDGFITLLRSACMYHGFEYMVLAEGGKAYKLYPSGERELLGDCALTSDDLLKYYSDWRGAASRCGDVLDLGSYSNGPDSFFSAISFDLNSKKLKKHSVNLFQEEMKRRLYRRLVGLLGHLVSERSGLLRQPERSLAGE
ncbi:hypothetical protein IJT17_10675 [bacterium]|nr:hypothetical protein [bacterium]